MTYHASRHQELQLFGWGNRPPRAPPICAAKRDSQHVPRRCHCTIQVAIKIIAKSGISNVGFAERVSREFFILTCLDHENVIRLLAVRYTCWAFWSLTGWIAMHEHRLYNGTRRMTLFPCRLLLARCTKTMDTFFS